MSQDSCQNSDLKRHTANSESEEYSPPRPRNLTMVARGSFDGDPTDEDDPEHQVAESDAYPPGQSSVAENRKR